MAKVRAHNTSDWKLYALVLVAYLPLAAGVIMLSQSSISNGFASLAAGTSVVGAHLSGPFVWICMLILMMMAFGRNSATRERVFAAIIVSCLTAVFFSTFLLTKSALAGLGSFFADPALARLDRELHFGHDPFDLALGLTKVMPATVSAAIYHDIWIVITLNFPAALTLLDGRSLRRRRYHVLFILTWLLLGHGVAFLAHSAGPVYYAALNGDGAFADISQKLAAAGINTTIAGDLQTMLWQQYQARSIAPGGAISAFPSLHVAMATLIALYLVERSRRLLLPAVLLVIVYQLLSVHLGWHYALDGYFSVFAVAVMWVWLRRRERQAMIDRAAQPAYQAGVPMPDGQEPAGVSG